MDSTRNTVLDGWMTEHGYSSNALARDLNAAIERFTGRPGRFDGRTVRDWKSGRVRWPNAATRQALKDVTGLDAEALGFVRRERVPTITLSAPSEDEVIRRKFLAGASGAALAAATPATAAPKRIGFTDVQRLHGKLGGLVADDNRDGGTPDMERRASGLADHAMDLQQNGSAGQRVRSQLYAVAASFADMAMWAAVDDHRPQDAQRHLNRAIALAGLANDPEVQFRVWRHAGGLYAQAGRQVDALAALEKARSFSIARRDPLHASLGHAMTALQLATMGRTREMDRSLHHAGESLEKAVLDAPRSPFMDFYDRAELEGLTQSIYLTVGRYEEAEACGYRSLALLRPELVRNRALALADLAMAQLHQGEAEQAVATACTVPIRGRSGRVVGRLNTFGRQLRLVAPGAAVTLQWESRFSEAAS
ncbi:XRE family transcriptional regulator [Streptomyces sp. GS7]|uniref:XRE family transcriptional regulator n=1 Tax=Streptomyces sp. GS7 TaxID=2692234 RepID=UPI001315E835|nr:XRE family transcriptional regulator [Streptomyces sp. GS7]QHC25646.1 XRE family transcriptional regulator [Streptomyces sp. GS7]